MTTPFFHDGTCSSFRGRRHGRPVDRAGVPGSRFVVSLQTHDQVGNRAQGDRLSGAQLDLDPGVLACGAAMLLTSPYTPMLFMGEEWAARTPWQFFTDHTNPEIATATAAGRKAEFGSHGWDEDDVPDPQEPATFTRSKLDWSEPEDGAHARMLRWYQALISLRRQVPDLRDPRLDAVDVSWEGRRFRSVRGQHVVLANLADEPWASGDRGQVLVAWDPDAVSEQDGAVVVPPRSAVVLATGG